MIHRVSLAVEDDDAEYYVIKFAVEETGMPIDLCRVADGEQALFFLEKSHGFEVAPRPDLILLNVNLPKRTGLEVLEQVRNSESLRSIPIVMFTSSSLATERQKALALGAKDFVWKPHTLSALLETLRSVCSRFLSDGVANDAKASH